MPTQLKTIRAARLLRILTIGSFVIFVLYVFTPNSMPTDEDVLHAKIKRHFMQTSNVTLSNKLRNSEVQTARVVAIDKRRAERTQHLKNLLQCRDTPLERQMAQVGKYWLLRNFVRGIVSQSVGCAETVTYATAGDFTAFVNLPNLVKRWRAPISFAVYTPGYDLGWTMDALQYVRHCLPESELIRKFVTFHMYFPLEHIPSYVPRSDAEVEQWVYSCRVPIQPFRPVDTEAAYRLKKSIGFPVNTGRNIACRLANTHFILTADSELMPSLGLPDQFLDMLALGGKALLKGARPRVFAMPAYNVAVNITLPTTPSQLSTLLRKRLAKDLRLQRCKNCDPQPGYANWTQAQVSHRRLLTIFNVAKPEEQQNAWELHYISDKSVPVYDERFIWEGPSTKRFQGYAMCLLGYEYHLLYPAFLVRESITFLYDKDTLRSGVEKFMEGVIKQEIRPEYNVIYGFNPECVI